MLKRTHYRCSLLLTALCLSLCSCSTPRQTNYVDETDYASPIRVACVGDSITYGAGIRDRDHNSYPAQLAVLLGDRWEVRNFGVSGSTLLKRGDRPYWDQPAYRDALAYEPDVVVIQLGTNDSKSQNWVHKDGFLQDYINLVESFMALESQPRIWICRPVPAFDGRWGISNQIIAEEVIPAVNEVAAELGVQVIDLYDALDGHAEMFPDGIHPNAAGAGVMAETVYSVLTGRQVAR